MSDSAGKLKIVGLSVSGFVIAIMLSAWVLIWRGSQDIDAPEVSDLAVEVIEVAPISNAMTYIEHALAAISWDEKLVDGGDPEVADLRGWLKGDVEIAPAMLALTMESNQAVFDELERAAACEYFVTPKSLLDEPIRWNMSGFLGLKTLVAAKARWQAQNGHHEEAARTLIASYRVALLIQGSGSNLIHMLVGHSMTSYYMEEMLHLARRPETPKAVIENMAKVIPESANLDEAFVESMKGEYLHISEYIDRCLATDSGRDELVAMSSIVDLPDDLEFLSGSFFRYRFHSNRTKQSFANYYRKYIFERPDTYLEALKKGYLDEDVEELGWQDALKPNALGTSLVQDSVITVGPYLFEKLCGMKSRRDANRVALIVIAYRKEHGEFPFSLKELEGPYLPRIPTDAYDGAAIRYSPKNHTIYSVGEDGVDDGGMGDDVVVKLVEDPPAPDAKSSRRKRRGGYSADSE